jgi:hypothetical protein
MANRAANAHAGYSWIVHILSEMEEGPLYQAISTNTNKFLATPFVTAANAPLQGLAGSAHAASAQLTVLACPSFSGDRVAGPDKVLVSAPASPYSSGAAQTAGTLGGGQGCAISNYHACAGTHINVTAPRKIEDNGALQFRGTGFDKGRGLSAMSQDGTSKTAEVVETREQAINCWIDGTTCWVVAARHTTAPAGNSMLNPPATLAAAGTTANGIAVGGRWIVPTTGGGHALNVGPSVQYNPSYYMMTGTVADPNVVGNRCWGPSSNHAGGIINHVCGDGHVQSVSESVDPNVYLWFYTRNGGETQVPE